VKKSGSWKCKHDIYM